MDERLLLLLLLLLLLDAFQLPACFALCWPHTLETRIPRTPHLPLQHHRSAQHTYTCCRRPGRLVGRLGPARRLSRKACYSLTALAPRRPALGLHGSKTTTATPAPLLLTVTYVLVLNNHCTAVYSRSSRLADRDSQWVRWGHQILAAQPQPLVGGQRPGQHSRSSSPFPAPR